MKFKKEYLALIIVIAALALYLAYDRADRTNYQLPDLESLKDKEITRLVIEKPDATVELTLKGDRWIISPQEYPADKSKIDPMIDAVRDVDLTALVSERENYHPYELDPGHRLHLTAWAGTEKVRELDIGKPAGSYRHTFVKLPGDPRVFHATGNIRNHFDKDIDTLRDKTVLAFDTPGIRQITIRKGEQVEKIALVQPPVEISTDEKKADEEKPPEPAWQTADGKAVDQKEIQKLLKTVSDLKCQSFIEKPAADFTDPVYSLTVSGDQIHKLDIYEKPEDEDNYPATSSGTEYPFELSSYKAEDIMKQLMGKEEATEKEEKKGTEQ